MQRSLECQFFFSHLIGTEVGHAMSAPADLPGSGLDLDPQVQTLPDPGFLWVSHRWTRRYLRVYPDLWHALYRSMEEGQKI